MGISLVAGRNFNTADLTGNSSAAIVDEALAGALYPGSSPIGKRFGFTQGTNRRDFEIVGVVENVVIDVDRSRIRPNYYIPEAVTGQNSGTSYVVRISGDPQVVVPEIRQAIMDVDPDFPVFGLTTLQEIVERTLSRQRQMSATWILFGATALLLTAIGLYGLMSYTVTRRVKEIGIRIALGATNDNVLLLVMRQFLKLVTAGLAAGFALSLVLNQVLRSYVFGVNFVEIWTLSTVVAIVVVVTTVASYLPARKGTRIDPVVALRSD
jgi:ABC-type antimicrobial peptide transport system permease subunit